jgi:mono/diheme cytochrome c family protein
MTSTTSSNLVQRCTLAATLASVLFIAGCRQDMHNQPKLIPQRGSEMFADQRGARPQVLNTIGRNELKEDSYFYTGVVEGANGYREERDQMPSELKVDRALLERGQERFNIYCSPCHSRVGNGLGAIVERGYKLAGNLHDQVRTSMPLSHYYYVMSHGYGAMPDYSSQLTPSDRWAVAAYIRALQLSQAADVKDVPAGVQIKSLEEIARETGTPEQYTKPWPIPSTAVQSYPAIKSEGTPALAPAYPADPMIKIPATPVPSK